MADQGQDRQPETVEETREDGAAMSRAEVAKALERIRFSLRQRNAERLASDEAAREAGVHDLPVALRQMWDTAAFSAPVLRSHRRLLGRLVVLFKRAGFHLFAKWYVRPLLEQQEAFNRATFHALRELYHAVASDAEGPADSRSGQVEPPSSTPSGGTAASRDSSRER